MNPTNDSGSDHSPAGARWPGEAGSTCDDPRVIRALEEYQAELEAGYRPDREGFQRRYPEIAEALAGCLAGLEFVQVAAPQLCPPEAAPDPAAVLVPEGPLGDYRLVREVGRGGMGVVYEAVQISLGRVVALKVLPFAAALDPRQLQRFKNEAQAAAHLHHPHIVPVYGVGCERGVHYYAMQFIQGQTLAALIRELRRQASKEDRGSRMEDRGSKARGGTATIADRDPRNETRPAAAPSSILDSPSSFFRKAAELGVQAAEALEHAHQLGVIHRDIKPANLLVDGQGDLFVTDFGLARLGSEAGLTMTGDLLGTLRYMSPEQALARRLPADPRTDVYSLGVTLYELLTQELAYNGRSREEVLHQIAFAEPAPPRRLNPAVPPELETIILKAMAKSPEERYATAQELADDLRRFLEDKPIRARRPSLRQRLVKWTRRHKTVVRAALVVLLLAIVALVVSSVFIWQANEGLKQALERERQNAYYQRIALAEREWSANNLRRMLELLDECPPDLRGWEWHYLNRLRLRVLPALRHDSAVFGAVFSPDGRHIAAASQDGKVTVWDAQSGQQLLQFRAHQDHARSVAYSPDGRLLATTSWDKTVKIWDTRMFARGRNPSLLHTLAHQGAAWNALFSPDGKRLASAGNRPGPPDRPGVNRAEIKVWDPSSGHELCTLQGQEGGIMSALAFSPDGRSLATGHVSGQDGIAENVLNV